MTESEQPTVGTQADGRASTLREVRFEYAPEFPRVLESLGSALLVSTYQAGKLLVIGVQAGRLTFAFHDFERVMGVAAYGDQLAVGTPVVTYPGRFLRGRISDALYHRMGMRSLVATDTATNTSYSPSGWRLTPISAISCLSN